MIQYLKHKKSYYPTKHFANLCEPLRNNKKGYYPTKKSANLQKLSANLCAFFANLRVTTKGYYPTKNSANLQKLSANLCAFFANLCVTTKGYHAKDRKEPQRTAKKNSAKLCVTTENFCEAKTIINTCLKLPGSIQKTLIAFFLFASIQLSAQNLESIGKEKPVKINGGVSANALLNASTDSVSYRDPYNYYMSGNLNLNIYDWNIPFTFSYSNQKTSFTQPFNQYCMHPKYKWATAHIGYTSMSFSPYTLNGHLFLGAGVDLAPEGPVSVSAMGGRLKKAIHYDTSLAYSLPEYERWGYALKTDVNISSLDFSKIKLSFIGFYAKDNTASLNFAPDSLVTPKENLVLSAIAQMKFKNNISLRAEYATSGLTNDTRPEVLNSGGNHLFTRFGSLYKTNNTSEFYAALKLNTDYSREHYSVGLGYERIAPGYQTLGAYYFNNDLENMTVNGSLKLLDSKINLGGNIGIQHDNLDNSKTSEMKRLVSAINLGYSSGKKLNASLGYSNFSSFTHVRSQFDYINATTPYDNYDTLNFTQLTESFSLNAGYIIANGEDKRQNLNFNLNFQKASEKQGDVAENAGAKFYNLNTSYSNSLVPLNLTWVVALNASLNNTPEMTTSTFGPTASVNKLFFEKVLRTTLSASYNSSFTNGEKVARVINIRANASATVKKHHNLNASLVAMNRSSSTAGNERKFTEFTATIGYSVNF